MVTAARMTRVLAAGGTMNFSRSFGLTAAALLAALVTCQSSEGQRKPPLPRVGGGAEVVEELRTIETQARSGQLDLSLPREPVDMGDYYVADGRKVPLLRSQEVVAVRFEVNTDKATADDVLSNLGCEVEILGNFSMRGMSLVRIAGRTDFTTDSQIESVVSTALSELNELPEVAVALPVFVNPSTGNRLLPTDEILVKPLTGVQVDDVAAQFDLVVAERLWGTRDEFVLRLPRSKQLDPLAVANAIAESGLIVWAEPNFVQEMTQFASPNDPYFPIQWHLNNTGQGGGAVDADVDAPEAWDITTGSASITIAIIDDGVQKTHEDLAERIYVNPGEVAGDGIDNDANGYVDDVSGWDFSNNDADASPRVAEDNHGTAVAGVAAATGDNGVGVSGVCQSCSILPVKVFDGTTFVGSVVVANAIRYAGSMADVLSNSWGGGAYSSAIRSAIQWASTTGRQGAGAPVFFASGNSASPYKDFSLGNVPAGTHRFRWKYSKNSSVSAGQDAAFVGWVEFPGGEFVDFQSWGLPSGFSTGGDADWSISTDRSSAYEGLCLTKSAKSGSIAHGQETYLDAVKTVAAGSLRYAAWVSSEEDSDIFELWVDVYNSGSWLGPFLAVSGIPEVSTSVDYPAAYPESVAIGASTDLDCRATYSQYGTALDLVAPSGGGISSITTTDRTGSSGYQTGNYTSGFSGTSAATPIAAGVAGLLLSHDSTLSEPEVRQYLQDTADKIGLDSYDVSGWNPRLGYGRVNASAVLQKVRPNLSIDDVTVTEGDLGPTGAEFSVTLSEVSAQTVTVDFTTANGTATAGEDYVAASGTLTILAGEISQNLTVEVKGDTTVEPDETFFVDLSNPSNASISDSQGRGTIADDDQPSVEELFDQTDNPSTQAISAQDFESFYDEYDAEAADDFVVTGDGWQIQRVGILASYEEYGGPADGVNLWFYGDASGWPGAAPICSYSGITPTSDAAGPLSAGMIIVDLPTACELGPGRHWLAAQIKMDYDVGGQVYWSQRTSQTGEESVWRNPGDGFGDGYTSWTRVTEAFPGSSDPDLIFLLAGVNGVPPIFADGFESGDCSAWSAEVP